jgi:hypothetical protein
MEEKITRRGELESFFKKYPDVPKEVIVKEDLLRHGLRFSKAALERAQVGRPRSYYIFSYDRTPLEEMKHEESRKAPDELRLEGGTYGLRKTLVSARTSYTSPYLIDILEEDFCLTSDGEDRIAKVVFPPIPKYYSMTFDDGSLYSEIVPLVGWGHRAFSTLLRKCGLWNLDLECKFCDLNANYRALKKEGRPYTLKKNVEKVVEVLKVIFLEQPEDEPRRETYILTGGSILSKKGSYADLSFYTEYVEKIKGTLGNRWPCILQTAAKDKESLKQLENSGVDCYHSNFEVWDENLFKVLCPGKEKFVGRKEWIERTIDAVDVFGEGCVTPGFVAGVEMCKPYGFEKVEDAVKSTVQGMNYLMSHGVIPRPAHWCIEPLSALNGNPIPPLEYFIEIDRAWYELWEKYKLPALCGYRDMGPGKSVNQNSAFLDMGS